MRIGLGTTGVYGSDRLREAYARDVPRLDDAFSFGSSGNPGSGHDPSEEVRPAAIRSALRERPALLALIALGVVVVAVVVVTALAGSDEGAIGDAVPVAGSQQVRVPALGDAAAVFLADGRPVFVVHHEDGTVSVVDAFSTHTPFGVGTLVGWCAATRTFDDLQHGSTFDEYGRYILGPAPSGLITFGTTALGTTPATIQVGARQLPAPRTELGTPFSGPRCTSPADILVHRIGQGQLTGSPAAAARGTLGRWMAVAGVLGVTQDDAARLCSSGAATTGPSCAPVSGVDGSGLLGAETTYRSDPSIWLVRTDGRELAEPTLVTGGQAS
jgi:Rieske Fe-S protein